MLSEYDVVSLRSGSNTIGVPVGTRGTVLIVYPDAPPAYEVEFVDDAGNSLGTFTMQERDLAGCGKSQPISLGGAAPGEKESRGAAVRNIRALTAVPPYQSFAHAVPRRGGHLFPQPVKWKA